MTSCTAVTVDMLISEHLSISPSRNNCLERHVRLRLSCLACHVGSSLKLINTPQGPRQKGN
ncbi:hypothetical protein SLEP1_g15135 [Rubroshorea leprosula]|uniref:Uncharacterized protein n=1 Tax=Rubroshorea leprosula TaxID=152421 RepID=A0AAV5IX64_9ROSI|nr:hypothetical protein SLEP1_g15135 [Rubroshorea leprosula]